MWKTKDLANYIGLTKKGVTYLEDKDIIKGERDRNSYRYYDTNTFITLANIKNYQKLGFTLDESITLNQTNYCQTYEHVQKKELEFINDYYQKLHAFEILKSRLHIVSQIKLNKIDITRNPGFYYLNDDGCIDTLQIQPLTKLMPITVYGIHYKDINNPSFNRIIMIQEADVSYLTIPLSELKYIPSSKCIHFIIEQSSNSEDVAKINPLYEFANLHGLKILSPAFAQVLYCQQKNQDYIAITEIWLPIFE